ncbi:MAG: carbamoyltransferase HypF [Bacillota bacterium]|nr:carbamoyltransferase HypF [Bacillota bacterium]
MDIECKKISITGTVQGVGFRPFVCRLAKACGIFGSVQNTGGAVLIYCCGSSMNLNAFIDGIKNHGIPNAKIESMVINDTPRFQADNFEVIESGYHDFGARFISPDLKLCENCAKEIFDAQNRRNGHFFNSCVNCGPRFSMIDKLPYDRKNTTMGEFLLCKECETEYTTQEDRRFHAESICCNECGPVLIYNEKDGTILGENGFQKAVKAIKSGKIIALKGIGGYHFCCLPSCEDSVGDLRKLKGRDNKPFAVMFKDIDEIRENCEVNEYEQELLLSNPSPITILKTKKPFAYPNVNGNTNTCGCFLPYTPLHKRLLHETGCLVMTSANVSGSPIIKDDEEMLRFLNEEESLYGVVSNGRRIVRRVEDSVVRAVGAKTQIIRRARGYVPTAIQLNNKADFIAMGGDLKAAFCLVKKNNAYLSQYFGDLEDEGVQSVYSEAIKDFQSLFDVKPKFAVVDKHPLYLSVQAAKSMSLPIKEVQHHHAHIASVMAEHQIKDKVIGVAFDGTGYGDDGNIWGGEFFICEKSEYQRVGHLKYTKILGGDSSMKDALKTRTCFLHACGLSENGTLAETINAALDCDINTVLSSSMGRLFDAVAAQFGFEYNGYEGECAIKLEQLAQEAIDKDISPYKMNFEILKENGELIADYSKIFYNILKEKQCDIRALALGFHYAVADMVFNMCLEIRQNEGISDVALSGGVFQNIILLSTCERLLKENGFNVYINHLVPPNDGGIALGQAFIASHL